MDASERDRLRELYSGWTTEELASAAALESCDYEREALELIMQELAARDDHAAPLLAAVGRAAWHRQGLARPVRNPQRPVAVCPAGNQTPNLLYTLVTP